MSDVCDMDLDGAVSDKLEEVGRIIEDTQRTRDPEGADPGLQLRRLGMLVVTVHILDVFGQKPKEAVDNLSAHCGTVKESSDGRKAIPVSPNARAEPGQETSDDQLLEPYLQRRHIRRHHPHRSMAGLPDDPIDRDAMRCEGVSGIPRRLGPTKDCNIGGALEQDVCVIEQVSTVEQWGVKRCASGYVRQERVRSHSSCNDKLMREKRCPPAAILIVVAALDGEDPSATTPLTFHRFHLGFEADAPVNVELLGVASKVVMQHLTGDMLARLHAKGGFIHGIVTVFEGAKHVIGLEARVQSVFGPYSTNCRAIFQDDDLGGRVHLDVGLCGSQSMPSCCERIDKSSAIRSFIKTGGASRKMGTCRQVGGRDTPAPMMTKSAFSMVVRGRVSVLLLLVRSVVKVDSSNALDPFRRRPLVGSWVGCAEMMFGTGFKTEEKARCGPGLVHIDQWGSIQAQKV